MEWSSEMLFNVQRLPLTMPQTERSHVDCLGTAANLSVIGRENQRTCQMTGKKFNLPCVQPAGFALYSDHTINVDKVGERLHIHIHSCGCGVAVALVTDSVLLSVCRRAAHKWLSDMISFILSSGPFVCVELLARPHLTLNMCHAARDKGTVAGEQITETNRVRAKPQEVCPTQQRSALLLVEGQRCHWERQRFPFQLVSLLHQRRAEICRLNK